METVICPRSFEIRRPLSSVCGLGYTVAVSALNTYWATDLMHRALHVPAISEDQVHHYTETFADVLELAKTEPEKAALDSDVLQYFAIDVWAYDIAAPGIGCSGEVAEEEEEEEAEAPATTTTTSASTPSETAKDEDSNEVSSDAREPFSPSRSFKLTRNNSTATPMPMVLSTAPKLAVLGCL